MASAELRTGKAGLGGPAAGVAALATGYDDARACAAVLDALRRSGGCAAPADIGLYRFLLSESGRADAAAVRPAHYRVAARPRR